MAARSSSVARAVTKTLTDGGMRGPASVRSVTTSTMSVAAGIAHPAAAAPLAVFTAR